jgi:hypothetical protein
MARQVFGHGADIALGFRARVPQKQKGSGGMPEHAAAPLFFRLLSDES